MVVASGHVQTIYARFLNPSPGLLLTRERWETPDNDFIDLDWLDSGADSANLIVFFMGWKAVRAVTTPEEVSPVPSI